MNQAPVRFLSILKGGNSRRGAVFGLILLLALLAFEIFNYTTTDFALTDMLGANLRFAGIRWATILALAFCGIDFAGIARLFTPEKGRDSTAEVWYLFGAWLLAAAMNAVLTWWGVAVAIRSHQELSSAFIASSTMTKIVPIFVALLVWLIRVFIIGTFSMAGERMFSIGEEEQSTMLQNSLRRPVNRPMPQWEDHPHPVRPQPAQARPPQRPEPTYHPAGFSARSGNRDNSIRR